MKNKILIAAVLFLQFSCSNRSKTTSESTATSNDSLLGVNTTRISPESDYFQSFRAIKKNIDSINATQQRIYFKTKDQVEFAPDLVTEINSEITRLNALLLENKTAIQDLNARLFDKSATNKALTDSILLLNDMLSENQGDIMDLNYMLTGANDEFRFLEGELYLIIAQNAQQNAQIVKSVKEANTAHYQIGTLKELKKQQIINEEGGVLGIGKRPVLNNDLNTDGFTKIDLRNVTALAINSKDARLLTIHSTKSYKLEKENNKVKQLTITDPKEFWRVSKYLVILKEN